MSASTATIQENKTPALGHGDFVWYELVTTDVDAAGAFYSSVVGWTIKDSGTPGMRYDLISAGPTQVGGIAGMPNNPPGWLGYIAVDDVDAYATRVKKAGGTIHREPQDIPGIGRFSVVGDPQGAVFILFKGNGTAPARPDPRDLGFVGWRELCAKDGQADFAFYAELFGWRKTEAHDMGPMGMYQTFSTNDGPMNCGAMDCPPGVPPHWNFYFTVDDIRAAVKRLEAGGGKVLHGPTQVPGGSWVVNAMDPQGAHFALTSAKG
jgi:hypothetical protein